MTAVSPVVLLTPTYGPDLEYFRFLRESARRWCPEIRHITVVQSEDMALFAEFRHDPAVTLLDARDVLRPADRWRRNRPHAFDRFLRRRFIGGWYAQQLIKLSGPKIVPGPSYVCIDSDHFFVRAFDSSDVYDENGKVKLLEHKYQPHGEIAEWNRRALSFFGLPTAPDPESNFIEGSVPFDNAIVKRMHEFIEKRHGTAWYKAMSDHQVTEYPAYGIFATRVDAPRSIGRSVGNGYFSSGVHEQASPERIAQRLWENTTPRHVKVSGVRSTTRIALSLYRDAVERIWERSATEV